MLQVYGAPERLQRSARESRLAGGDLSLDIVSGAIIPPSVRQEIRSNQDETFVFNGWKAGVYDSTGSVCESSLIDRDWTRVTVAFEAGEVRAFDRYDLGGEAVYCGLLFHHFGHFLLESTSRLWWPLTEAFTGLLVFQNTRPDKPLPDFALRFFALLGIADRIRVVDIALGFDRVIVPHRSFIIQASVHPSFLIPFARAGAAAERQRPWRPLDDAREKAGVYLSRTHYTKRRALGERRLQQALAAEGFCILHMEELPLEQQILAVRRFATVVGIAGSAFHNILFSSQPKTCIYICKDYNINCNFFMVDEIMRNEATYLYNGCAMETEPELSNQEIFDMYLDERKLDIRKLSFFLTRIGVLSHPF